jgi:general secretion pathway protein H
MVVPPRSARRDTGGFTLLELLVVMAIIALASVGVSLSLPDSATTRLEREGLRLSALLESARAQSRTRGVAVQWRGTAGGFEFPGETRPAQAADAPTAPRAWLHPDTRAIIVQPAGASALVLGPEPLIPAQRVVLTLGAQRITLGTDGLSPFAVVPEAPTP